jgi:hypothetical protein
MSDHTGVKDLAPMYDAYPKYGRKYISQALIGVEPWKYMSYIPEYSFYDCRGIANITIPDGVTSIGDYAFYGCRDLISVEIPNSVTSICESAFGKCYALSSIKFNGTKAQLRRINLGANAFMGVAAKRINCSDDDN